MKAKKEYFFCSPRLLQNVAEIREIDECIGAVRWSPSFKLDVAGRTLIHQTAYNRALALQFEARGWELQPKLFDNPKLIGDFRKNDVFVEVQFGNSASIYRDYYKFHYGLTHGLLSLAVLIVPVKPTEFFPTRPKSVRNMAEFDLAATHFRLLPIPVPILLVGLLPSNS